MTAEPKQMPFGEVLKLGPVRALWIGQLVSILGGFLAIFAVMSVVSFRMNGTPAQMTLLQIPFMLPLTIVGPVAGVFVDRISVALQEPSGPSPLIRRTWCDFSAKRTYGPR